MSRFGLAQHNSTQVLVTNDDGVVQTDWPLSRERQYQHEKGHRVDGAAYWFGDIVWPGDLDGSEHWFLTGLQFFPALSIRQMNGVAHIPPCGASWAACWIRNLNDKKEFN